jgi:hypothetical protein
VSLVQYDYSVKESQRLADLTGIRFDLEAAIRYCDLHIEIDPTESGITIQEASRREHTRQALCRAGLVMYGRAWGWGSGARLRLGDETIGRMSPHAVQFHDLVKALRDKWVAHAVNHFDEVRVQIDVNQGPDMTETVRGVSVTTLAVGGFVRDWMMQFRALVSEVESLVQSDTKAESDRISELVRHLPIDSVKARARVDGVPLERQSLNPKKARRGFVD